MRLEHYLTERYLSAIQSSGDTYEIWKNPSKKELWDLSSEGYYGYRFILDFSKKNAYFASQDIFHQSMMTDPMMKKELNFNWALYWAMGKGSDRIIMGSCQFDMQSVNSDSLRAWYQTLQKDKYEEVVANLKKIQAVGFDWLKKYGFRTYEFDKIIKKAIKDLDDYGAALDSFGQR